jgi:mevalonate kinase
LSLPTVTASAPGKIIIVGEHFVVHGAYAVAAAIDRRVRVTVSEAGRNSFVTSGNRSSLLFKNDGQFSAVKAVARKAIQDCGKPSQSLRVKIASNIPSGSGLGSSAAVVLATAAACSKFLGQNFEKAKIAEIALLGERLVHGNPSGIDIESSLAGGLLLFNRNAGMKPIPIAQAMRLLVVYSGKKRRTADLIMKVAMRKRQFPSFFESLTRSASFLSLDMVDAIAAGDLPKVGALMNVSQTSLSWIGVSTAYLDRIIESLCEGGAYGAKVTGAGGGGSIIALAKPEETEQLLDTISKKYPESFITSIPQEGLRWED